MPPIPKRKIVCFAGKGGVGKSTSAILFLKYLNSKYPDLRKIIIDADPDANILDLLNKSLSFYDTIGGKIATLHKQLARKALPPNTSEKTLIENLIFQSIIKFDNYDLIVMGRREGEGCYCSVNNILKNIINIFEDIYDIVIIDSPAGLEFFARKTSTNVDDLILVVDTSKMSFHTIQRLMTIKTELSLKFKKVWVLVNKFSLENKETFLERIKEFSNGEAKLLGFLAKDTTIQEFNLLQKSLLDLPDNNPLYQDFKSFAAKII